MFGTPTVRTLTLITLLLFVGCDVDRDSREAQEVASRIHNQFSQRDFNSIYTEATPHFKQLKQQEFTALLEKIYQDHGVMQKATALAYKTEADSAVGHRHVIISDLEFERARARERLVPMRGEDGRMRLWDMVIEPQ